MIGTLAYSRPLAQYEQDTFLYRQLVIPVLREQPFRRFSLQELAQAIGHFSAWDLFWSLYRIVVNPDAYWCYSWVNPRGL